MYTHRTGSASEDLLDCCARAAKIRKGLIRQRGPAECSGRRDSTEVGTDRWAPCPACCGRAGPRPPLSALAPPPRGLSWPPSAALCCRPAPHAIRTLSPTWDNVLLSEELKPFIRSDCCPVLPLFQFIIIGDAMARQFLACTSALGLYLSCMATRCQTALGLHMRYLVTRLSDKLLAFTCAIQEERKRVTLPCPGYLRQLPSPKGT